MELSKIGTDIASLDIGGTLSKLVLFQADRCNGDNTDHLQRRNFLERSETYGETGHREKSFQFHSDTLGGTFHFVKFQTRRMKNFFDISQQNGLARNLEVCVTGGGAFKFENEMESLLGKVPNRFDELACLVHGVNFLMTHLRSEIYSVKDASNFSPTKHLPFEKNVVSFNESDKDASVYPYLLVNIGSGVSILLVESSEKYRRVGGTCLGGGTFFGLCSKLTSCQSFKDALALAEKGDNSNVDMLVRDIYGGDYTHVGLSGDVVASTFGKMMRQHSDGPEPSDADTARSILLMITNNIGALARLHAQNFQAKRVVFTGSFLQNNTISIRALAYALDFWSQGAVKALFLEKAGYAGAIGGLLLSQAREDIKRLRLPSIKVPQPPLVVGASPSAAPSPTTSPLLPACTVPDMIDPSNNLLLVQNMCRIPASIVCPSPISASPSPSFFPPTATSISPSPVQSCPVKESKSTENSPVISIVTIPEFDDQHPTHFSGKKTAEMKC
eukprot:TRINITY_DN4618_c0_g1::TRINITY_DN4618_c0_g1_i1::g.19554::m.19554 TRINITY_DN4618_c0_g1::TRINITY_DN4618_c0_g1_i1::g.19554  ORF type:complete len:551 (-),score=73.40,sp/Q08DA5/PANK3_BOVIN/43.49/7e-83,Fumble/PF03630.9/1.3e-106 TRINITY_DN4618_c0_g1_i1:485-1987(-)